MAIDKRFYPYLAVFAFVCIALSWRPFLIGFYGDDFSHANAESLAQALFYGRQERFLYFFPIALPRYVFGHDPIGWGVYAIVICGLTAVILFSLFRAILCRLENLSAHAPPAAMAGAVLYILMPWSLAPVLWNTGLSQLVMVALMALAGTVLFSRVSLGIKSALFVALFSASTLIYETIWGAWIPLILIKLSLDAPQQRKETFTITAWAVLAQIALILNYLPSYGLEGRVMSSGGIDLAHKLSLYLENVVFRFPFEVVSSMGVVGLFATPFFLYALFGLFKHKREKTDAKFWLVVASCIAGILGGILIVTLGNYRITATSDDARFLSVVSLWLALLVSMAASILAANASRAVRVASYIVYVSIILAFFLRAGEWVQGYFFQRDVLASIPAEKIAQLIKSNQKTTAISPDFRNNMLLVEFSSPTHIFHGLHNNRGTNFISAEITKQTGIDIFTLPTNRRVLKTGLDGTRLYQHRCLDTSDYIWNFDNPNHMIVFWHYGTGEVRKVNAPFEYGCTRTIERYEFLWELLYPFAGNPRRL